MAVRNRLINADYRWTSNGVLVILSAMKVVATTNRGRDAQENAREIAHVFWVKAARHPGKCRVHRRRRGKLKLSSLRFDSVFHIATETPSDHRTSIRGGYKSPILWITL